MLLKNSIKQFLRKNVVKLRNFLEDQTIFSEYEKYKASGVLSIGRDSYGVPKIWVYKGSEAKVIIGSFCSIAPGVKIITGGIHPVTWVSTFPFRIKWGMDGAYCDGMPETRGDIVIGSDVWIGTDVTILSGINIGHGAIISAGSIVTRSVPSYAIIGGSPAKIIKYRYPADVVEKMLEIAWWDWEDSKIREAVSLLSSDDIQSFLKKYSPKEL